ncbi:MAG: hypothetical protein VXW43_19425, partial [Pseudomonadota bacterium]|nr:hypothetical protein [Pseudomonadota bacterium]
PAGQKRRRLIYLQRDNDKTKQSADRMNNRAGMNRQPSNEDEIAEAVVRLDRTAKRVAAQG